jgi:flagella basal body P-ring formation protein FlgA
MALKINSRILSLALVSLSALTLSAGASLAAEESPAISLRVHMPRTMKIEADTVKLGEICVLRCDDDAVLAKASAVSLGRAPFVKEELRIDRNTILSRLAASGITSSAVTITGAQAVTITRDESVVDGAELVHAAEAFLAKSKPLAPQMQWKLQGPVPDLAVGNKEAITIECRLRKDTPQGNPQVEVAVMAGRQQLDSRELTFTLSHQVRQITAAKEIMPGDMITPDSVTIAEVASDTPQPWVSPFGMTAIQRIGKGAVVNISSLKQPAAAIAVHRGQTVVMKIEGSGFVISALGQSADDGKPGDSVRVRNIDTNRVVIARVNGNGTVTPFSNEVK